MKDVFQPIISLFSQLRGIRILLAAIKRFAQLGHKTHAAALTYTTLFALVPLLTVTYSVLSMIPALQQGRGEIEQLLLGNLVPASGDTLMGYLYQFSEQARQLTSIGIVLLLITAFMMLRSIENSFNQVWQLKHGRKGLSSFLLYWAILSLGPLMLSAGLAVSSYIGSLGLWRENWVPTSGTLLLAIVIPYLTSFLAFTLIYWAVPNCKVPLKHAALGGAFVALLFEVGQEIFAEATTFFPSYQLIYGAFAAVPLFLLWLFVSWSVILFGAEVVFLLGSIDNQDNASDDDLDSGSDCAEFDVTIGLKILRIMSVLQEEGEGIPAQEILTRLNSKADEEKIALSSAQLKNTLNHLVGLKLLIQQENLEYYLVRDLTRYPLYEFVQHVSPNAWLNCSKNAGEALLEELLVQQKAELEKNLSMNMASLVQREVKHEK